MTTESLQARVLGRPGLRHGFFTRRGGVSDGIYASLNCGFGSRDERPAVAENRARVARALDLPQTALLTVHQTHSAEAVIASAPWAPDAAPRADALASRTPGLALTILTADCTPVLLADAKAGVIGAAHAGWRGALGGILDAVVAAMEELGARREAIAAAIGPTIRQPSYEVGAELRQAFVADAAGNARFFAAGAREGHFQFDLPGYVLARLAGLGLAAIEDLAVDTYAEAPDFFSYRRTTHHGEPDYGRQVSSITLVG